MGESQPPNYFALFPENGNHKKPNGFQEELREKAEEVSAKWHTKEPPLPRYKYQENFRQLLQFKKSKSDFENIIQSVIDEWAIPKEAELNAGTAQSSKEAKGAMSDSLVLLDTELEVEHLEMNDKKKAPVKASMENSVMKVIKRTTDNLDSKIVVYLVELREYLYQATTIEGQRERIKEIIQVLKEEFLYAITLVSEENKLIAIERRKSFNVQDNKNEEIALEKRKQKNQLALREYLTYSDVYGQKFDLSTLNMKAFSPKQRNGIGAATNQGTTYEKLLLNSHEIINLKRQIEADISTDQTTNLKALESIQKTITRFLDAIIRSFFSNQANQLLAKIQ